MHTELGSRFFECFEQALMCDFEYAKDMPASRH